jgi:hypothetical protein
VLSPILKSFFPQLAVWHPSSAPYVLIHPAKWDKLVTLLRKVASSRTSLPPCGNWWFTQGSTPCVGMRFCGHHHQAAPGSKLLDKLNPSQAYSTMQASVKYAHTVSCKNTNCINHQGTLHTHSVQAVPRSTLPLNTWHTLRRHLTTEQVLQLVSLYISHLRERDES